MTYLDNSPPVLRRLHERLVRSQKAHRSNRSVLWERRRSLTPSKVLEILLCDKRMGKAWRIISKSLVNEEDYENLYHAIIEAMRLARHGIVDHAARKERYRRIINFSEKLIELIAEPHRPVTDGSAYRGELDLLAYEFFPEDVASILGAQSWTTMKSDERSDWAASLLPEWPTMVELLEQLTIRARLHGSVPVALRRRSRRFLEEETDDEIMTKTRARLFACYLDDQLRAMDSRFRSSALLKAIASVVYEVNLDHNALKKVISDHRKKQLPRNEEKSLLSTPSE